MIRLITWITRKSSVKKTVKKARHNISEIKNVFKCFVLLDQTVQNLNIISFNHMKQSQAENEAATSKVLEFLLEKPHDL